MTVERTGVGTTDGMVFHELKRDFFCEGIFGVPFLDFHYMVIINICFNHLTKMTLGISRNIFIRLTGHRAMDPFFALSGKKVELCFVFFTYPTTILNFLF